MDMTLQQPSFSVCQKVLSGHWKLPILWALDLPRRFGELQTILCLDSRGVLSTQLQELLHLGLIHQEKYTCFPPRVEYSLTDSGRALCEILAPEDPE